MGEVMNRLLGAINARDLDAFVACFAPDYRGERIAWGRLYMEVIEQDGADIDQMVRDAYRPPGTE